MRTQAAGVVQLQGQVKAIQESEAEVQARVEQLEVTEASLAALRDEVESPLEAASKKVGSDAASLAVESNGGDAVATQVSCTSHVARRTSPSSSLFYRCCKFCDFR